MGTESTCELVEFRVESARFLNIEPRPRADSPQDLEQNHTGTVEGRVGERVAHLRRRLRLCGRQPVAVASREQIKKVSDGTYTAWYQVVLTKYRTQGECMPQEDEAPD